VPSALSPGAVQQGGGDEDKKGATKALRPGQVYTSPADQGLAGKLFKQLEKHDRFGVTAKMRVSLAVR
jgi:hypothetical protein